jgi:HlyD family secretion protein
MPDMPLIPAELGQDTVESLYTGRRLDRPVIYWLVLGACLLGMIVAPLIKIDVSISAAGMVRPVIERCDLQTPIAGLISQVLAHDNDCVQAGQPLVVLQSRDVDERLSRNHAIQVEHQDMISDLNAVTTSGAEHRARLLSPADFSPPSLEDFRTSAFHQEYLQFLASLEANRLATAKSRSVFDRVAALGARGIATQCELDDSRYELSRVQAEGTLLVQQTFARWEARLREEQTALDALVSEEKRLREERALYTVRAPSDGVLLGFNGLSAGVFVPAGQALGALSPADSLVVEALVPPRDVGLIRLGQPVKLQIDAYPYTQWGMLEGEVIAISGDVTSGYGTGTSGSSPFQFKVTIRPAATVLNLPNGLCGDLKKGLTVQTRFLVARRSLLRLLYDDIRSSFDPNPVRIRSTS